MLHWMRQAGKLMVNIILTDKRAFTAHHFVIMQKIISTFFLYRDEMRWKTFWFNFNAFKWLSKELFCFLVELRGKKNFWFAYCFACLHTFFLWCSRLRRLFSMNCKMLIKFIFMFINALVCLRNFALCSLLFSLLMFGEALNETKKWFIEGKCIECMFH